MKSLCIPLENFLCLVLTILNNKYMKHMNIQHSGFRQNLLL